MIRGLAAFTEYFRENGGDYVVIGGLATAMVMGEFGFVARATKDLDMVVVAKENEEFLKKLLRFIDLAGYRTKQRTDNGRHNLFRFSDSEDKNYPEQIELFAVHSGDSQILADGHIIPIETPEYYAYLSAILLDADYYNLLVNHTTEVDGLHVATPEALIPLKIHAYLNLSNAGSSDANKHFTDVIRLAGMLDEDTIVILQGTPQKDMTDFLPILERTDANTVRNVVKGAGMKGVTKQAVLQLLRSVYRMEQRDV